MAKYRGLDTMAGSCGNEPIPVVMTEVDELDAAISDALLLYPDALVEFTGPDQITHALGYDIYPYLLSRDVFEYQQQTRI